MKLMLVVLLMLSGLTSCAMNNYAATGEASTAQVMVTYFYNGAGSSSVIDVDKANALAKQKCATWGYSDVTALGEENEACTRYTGDYGCYYYRVEKPYQCTAEAN